MRKVRLCALLLAATLSVTSMPAVGVSAAQVDASKSYAVSQEQVHTAAPVKEAKNIKTSPATRLPLPAKSRLSSAGSRRTTNGITLPRREIRPDGPRSTETSTILTRNVLCRPDLLKSGKERVTSQNPVK